MAQLCRCSHAGESPAEPIRMRFSAPTGSSALGLQAALPRRDIETGIASCDTLQGL